MLLLPLLIVTVIVTSIYLALAILSLNLCSNPKGMCYYYPHCLVKPVEILSSKGIFPLGHKTGKQPC